MYRSEPAKDTNQSFGSKYAYGPYPIVEFTRPYHYKESVQVFATSGGFLPRINSGGARPGGLSKWAIELTEMGRPRITLIMTSSGDDRM